VTAGPGVQGGGRVVGAVAVGVGVAGGRRGGRTRGGRRADRGEPVAGVAVRPQGGRARVAAGGGVGGDRLHVVVGGAGGLGPGEVQCAGRDVVLDGAQPVRAVVGERLGQPGVRPDLRQQPDVGAARSAEGVRRSRGLGQRVTGAQRLEGAVGAGRRDVAGGGVTPALPLAAVVGDHHALGAVVVHHGPHVGRRRPARAERAGGAGVQGVVGAGHVQGRADGGDGGVRGGGGVVAGLLVIAVTAVLRESGGDQWLSHQRGEGLAAARGRRPAVVGRDRPVVRLRPVQVP
jgi:hypothetical protein